MKKSITTQELVNVYPPWSKVRSDDQSVGYQLLNALAQPLERMDKQLSKMRDNQYLATFNLDEIDLAYKVQLPATFEFEFDTTDPVQPVPIAPTVLGKVGNDYLTVSLADDNDIPSFWYDALPDRMNNDLTASGEVELLSQPVNDFPWSGVAEHHLIDDQGIGGGHLWIEASGGTEYVSVNDRKQVERASIILRGVTRKGTEEEETLIFPWDEKKKTLKEWKRLTSIDVFNMESGVDLTIRSADFSTPPYWSHYNLRFSDRRTKVDEFWQLNDTGENLERAGFVSDQWQDVILGFSEREVKEAWELLDGNYNQVVGVDMAVQPFSDRAWVVTASGLLYCYSLDEDMVSGVDNLIGSTPGAEVDIEVEKKRIIFGEDIVFTPWHARPLREIQRYRVWYQEPDGTKLGILDGAAVSYTSDFWVYGRQLKRVITDTITITPDQRGEYVLVLEVEYIDDDTETRKVIVSVQSKLPLASYDLELDSIQSIDFDSDQKLWIRKTNGDMLRYEMHYDKMLIDYQNKILYFRENYTDIQVTP